MAATAILVLLFGQSAGAGDGEAVARLEGPPVLLASLVPEPGAVMPAHTPGIDRRDAPPARIELVPGVGSPETMLRILSSRSPADPRWYPSPFQAGPAAVSVSGIVETGGARGDLATIYLRVVNAGIEGDSTPDPAMPGDVELFDTRGATLSRSLDGIYRLTSEAPGRFRVVARVVGADGRAPVAGMGFSVEASADADFSCGNACARTGVFRLWRRICLELDSMYRAGATVSTPAAAGVTRVAVDDVRPFRSAKPARPLGVLLMTAPIRGGAARREEAARVIGVDRPDRRHTSGSVILAGPVPVDLAVDDAIVVPGAGAFEMPSIEMAKSVFAKAHVELVEIGNPNRIVPHRAFAAERRGEDFNAFAQRWSDYGDGAESSSRNVVMVVAADHKTQQFPSGDVAMHPAIGSCNVRPSRVNNVFLWRGAVERQVLTNEKGIGIGGKVPDDVMDELIVHELAHLFGVDDCDTCERRENDEGTGLSSMSVPVGPEMGDGVSGFHAAEYLQIRTSADPLPQS